MKKSQGILLLIIFSIFTGLGGYFVKLTIGINPQQILFFRALLASIFIFTIAVIQGNLKELKFRFPANTIIMAIVEGLSIFFFYAALERTTVTNAILLTYTAPIFSVILSAIFLHEKIERKTLGGIFLSLTGVLIISNPSDLKLGSDQMIGSLFALLGGFFYAAMAISSKSLTAKTKPIYSAFWQYFIIMILTFFFAIGTPLQAFTNNLFPLLYLGWIAGGLAFILYMKGIDQVKGQNIQIITMLEVLVASLSGVILLHEPLSFPIVCGGILILGGVIVVSVKRVLPKKTV